MLNEKIFTIILKEILDSLRKHTSDYQYEESKQNWEFASIMLGSVLEKRKDLKARFEEYLNMLYESAKEIGDYDLIKGSEDLMNI